MFEAPFFGEFVVEPPVDPDEIIDSLSAEGFLAGINLAQFDFGIENGMLIAVTEKRTREEMDRYIALLGEFS